MTKPKELQNAILNFIKLNPTVSYGEICREFKCSINYIHKILKLTQTVKIHHYNACTEQGLNLLEELIGLRQFSLAEVARRCGMSPRTVSNYIKEQGLDYKVYRSQVQKNNINLALEKTNIEAKDPITYEKILKLREAGLSFTEIGKVFNTSRQNIYKRLKAGYP